MMLAKGQVGESSMVVAQRRMMLEEFLALPERKPALEFEDGVVTKKVSPKGVHSVLQGELYERLTDFGRLRKLARAFTELRVTFGGNSYVPDLCVFRLARIPKTAAGEVADDFTEPPDIAVEIVSPRQGVTALVRRCLWYVDNGVQVALLVDPKDRSALLFHPGEQPRALRRPDRIDLGRVLPGFELTVGELFGTLRLE
jgi:Uma2 family endonuclease